MFLYFSKAKLVLIAIASPASIGSTANQIESIPDHTETIASMSLESPNSAKVSGFDDPFDNFQQGVAFLYKCGGWKIDNES